MTCFNEKALNPAIYIRIDHHLRPVSIRAGQPGCRAKQAADQRALGINLATLAAKMGAT